MSDFRPSGGPFANWDDAAWDHPLRFIDAIRLWSPEFARRLDQVKWLSADEIRIVAQQRRRQRMRYDHPASEGNLQLDQGASGDNTPDITPDPAIGAVNPEIPEFLRNDLARLLREWDRWDDEDRLVGTSKLAGRLIIEKTRPGQHHILKHLPPVPPVDLSTDDLPVGQMRHDALGPYDLDLRTSMIRDAAGNWLPARILGGIEAEAERMRLTRLAREAEDAAAAAAWAAERAKPMRERQYFRYDEIANALARKPGRLEVDAAERDRIVLDLADWTSRGEFDLSGDSEVVTLIGEPPYFVPLAPVPSGGILVRPEWLILRRDACRRYLTDSPLTDAPRLLRNWFPEAAPPPPSASGETPSPDTGEPEPAETTATSAREISLSADSVAASDQPPQDTGEPQPLTRAESGQAPSRAYTSRPKAQDADVQTWYKKTYIPECETAGKQPSEATDWAAARLKFGDKVRRYQIRDLRRELAPTGWRIQGRRPSSKNPANNSA
jgi:hypothetical protein